jgi:hypothetical protein
MDAMSVGTLGQTLRVELQVLYRTINNLLHQYGSLFNKP